MEGKFFKTDKGMAILPLARCVTLGWFLGLSVPLVFHCETGMSSSPFLGASKVKISCMLCMRLPRWCTTGKELQELWV